MIQKAFRPAVSLAVPEERESIYRLRHQVYALELGQHPANSEGRLRDPLDEVNVYLVGREEGEIAGFISITPPSAGRYSIDKYFSRPDLPIAFDGGLFEVRLLTVTAPHRGGPWALLLMHAALRWIEEQGGTRVVAIGRDSVVGMYERTGLRRLGFRVRSGRVTYELMSASVAELREAARPLSGPLDRLRSRVGWDLELPDRPAEPCFHGGASFAAIGDEFRTLERRHAVINADVLDAWFPPAPGVIRALEEDLSWIVRSSPPASADGLVRSIARTRGIPASSIVVGAGSSDLLYRAFTRWLDRESRVLILDPMYGEYAHVLERVVGCRVDRLSLDRADGYRLDPIRLLEADGRPWDLVVLVNPNNPTGRHVPRAELERALRSLPPETRVWIDEAYVDYAGPGESLEPLAAASGNIVVCKSLSKVHALSGVRCAYLCAPERLAADLRRVTPPWIVGLPAQIAGVRSLEDPGYYRARWEETARLRGALAEELRGCGDLDVLEGKINSLLVHLPPEGPDAATVVRRCRESGLFVRDATLTSGQLGDRAVRIAVKDATTNGRMLEIFRKSLGR